MKIFSIHPDVELVEPEGNVLHIDQIQEVRRSASLTRSEGKRRIFILEEADRMTDDAANSFLKTLEEPPAGVVFILLATNLDVIPETIISRSRIIRFRPLTIQQIAGFLVRELDVGEGEAEVAARVSGGILGDVVSFLKLPAKRKARKLALETAQELAAANPAQVSFAAEELSFEAKNALAELKGRHERELEEAVRLAAPDELPKGLSKKIQERHKRELDRAGKNGAAEIIGYFAAWYRDILMLLLTDRTDSVTNQDLLIELREQAENMSVNAVYACLEEIEKARQQTRYNVNMQLVLEVLLLNLQGILVRIDGAVEAFAIASGLTAEIGVLSFEKARSEIKGLYQFLDNECARRLFSAFSFINKESDMGLPGLAQSKNSYHPIEKIKSFRLTVK